MDAIIISENKKNKGWLSIGKFFLKKLENTYISSNSFFKKMYNFVLF